jgi:pentatricopeptide repeat protein
VALARSGRLEEAITHFRQAMEANPNSAEIHNNLARALAKTGRIEEAIALFQRMLETNPNSAELHNSLGVALVWTRRPAEAIAQFEKALELNPAFTEARYNLGDTLYYLQGRAAEALAEWRDVLRAAPNHLAVLDQTARLLATAPDATLRNGPEAVALAERAAQLTGGREPQVLDTLAAAYAEAGRFDEAVQTARQALALALEANKTPLSENLKARIALYESRTPLRTAQQPAGSSPRP